MVTDFLHWLLLTRCRLKRDVTVLARLAVSAARPSTRLADPTAGSIPTPRSHAPGGRQACTAAALQTTTTDDCEQNNTGPLGGPVIIWQKIVQMRERYFIALICCTLICFIEMRNITESQEWQDCHSSLRTGVDQLVLIIQYRSERRADAEFHPQSQRSTDYHSVSSVTLVTHLQTHLHRLHADRNQ